MCSYKIVSLYTIDVHWSEFQIPKRQYIDYITVMKTQEVFLAIVAIVYSHMGQPAQGQTSKIKIRFMMCSSVPRSILNYHDSGSIRCFIVNGIAANVKLTWYIITPMIKFVPLL